MGQGGSGGGADGLLGGHALHAAARELCVPQGCVEGAQRAQAQSFLPDRHAPLRGCQVSGTHGDDEGQEGAEAGPRGGEEVRGVFSVRFNLKDLDEDLGVNLHSSL